MLLLWTKKMVGQDLADIFEPLMAAEWKASYSCHFLDKPVILRSFTKTGHLDFEYTVSVCIQFTLLQ